jgi:hypothetical protein
VAEWEFGGGELGAGGGGGGIDLRACFVLCTFKGGRYCFSSLSGYEGCLQMQMQNYNAAVAALSSSMYFGLSGFQNTVC